ncbi:MAG: hypothetical protein A2176_01245 [Spirochaetes bacterium RBG_13_51_14]|nr:MAG: hypothetical protein A2176_01245 [Spirochaetes bacterium RBG_13_51_14]
MLNLHVEKFNDIYIISLEGIFDINNLARVESVWLEQTILKPRMIAINCAGLEAVDSSAIGTIVKLFNYSMNMGIMPVLYDLSPLLRRLFMTAKLNRCVTIATRSEFENHIALKFAPLPIQFSHQR